jgi:hypothetical protein
MQIRRSKGLWIVAVIAVAIASIALRALAADGPRTSALGIWLPNPDAGFTASLAGRTSVTNQYDYFVCGTSSPTVKPQNFDYAGSACPGLTSGTAFSYGAGEPNTGRVVYDRVHRIVFYSKGCCAWRGFALTAHVGSPPATVASVDLSGVRTHRGVTLGMTTAAVERIYGAAKPHAAKDIAGATTLSYATPTSNAPQRTCGQWQSFSFKQDRLISIDLLAGC